MESLSGVRCPLSDRIMTERVRCRLGVLIEAYSIELRLGLGRGGAARTLHAMTRLNVDGLCIQVYTTQRRAMNGKI